MVEVMRQTRQTGTIIAERNAKNLFHIEMTNLPGDVKLSYPYLMESGREDESQYNLAFYFAPNVDSLDDIEDIDSIVRIAAQTKPDANGEAEMFVREYSSQFYVPNALNRVRIQKMDYQGNRLTGAVFTMYQAYSAAEREGYMPVTSGEYAGMYYNPQVVNQDGTLKTRGEILNAAPWDSGATTSEEATVEGGLSLDGAMIFPTAFDEYVIDSTSGAATGDYEVNPDDTSTFMEEGEYVIYETESPQGYEVNLNPIRVTVNDSGVYADAGGENDGVRVGQYAGMVLNSMTNFAAENVVDQSLTFLDTTLMVQGNNGLEAPQEGEITWLNKYSNEHGRYVFYADDVARYVTSGRNLYQFTESGTPQLVVKQCDHIYSYVLILGGEYSGYDGPVYLTKSSVNTGGAVTEETVEVTAKDGTLAYWLLKGDNGNVVQSLAGVEVAGTDGRRIPLDETQYAAYEPRMDGLSGYDDLSGLLSVETLVQVYDRGVGSLRVTKQTENNDTNQGEPFRFRVYSVYENATKIVLAKFRDGQIVYKNDVNGNPTGEPETVPYNGVLNIRLRQDSSDEHSQYTAVNISAEFENGVSMIYLHDGYSVENIYLPENADHPLYAGKEENIEIAGRVETRITLDDSSVSGNAEVVAGHVAFENNSVTHTLNFENGSATYYRNPNYTVSSITINGVTYSNSELSPDAEHLFTVETRYQYASVDEISNVSTAGELPVSFSDVTFENGGITYEDSDEDRIVLQSDAEGGTGSGSGGVDDYDRITVEEKDGGGYIMHYSLESDTNTKATVAQFALYANQSVLIEGLPAGAVYYVYEYAVGKESADYDSLEAQWSTVVTDIGENSTAGIQTVNEPQSYDAGGDDGEIDPSKQPHGEISGYRAYKGGIEITRTPHVLFTNSRLGNLEITKTVAGAQLPESERTREFEFKIQLVLPDGGGAAGNTYTVDAVRTTPNGTGEPVQTEFTLTFVKLDENGAESDSGTLTATAALKDGETVTLLKLPVNAEYDVTETQNDGYSVEISGETEAR